MIFNTANVNVSNIGIHGTQTTQTNADILIINKINLRPSAYSALSASSDIKLTHPHWISRHCPLSIVNAVDASLILAEFVYSMLSESDF